MKGPPVPTSLNHHQPGTGQSASTIALPVWPRVPGGVGGHSRHCSGIGVPLASIMTQMEALPHCGSAQVAISGAEHMQDPKEESHLCCDPIVQGAVAKEGMWPLARVSQHFCVSLLTWEQLTSLALT